MKGNIYVLFLLSAILYFGCEAKRGMYEIVQVETENTASTDVFVTFLNEQIESYPEEADNYIKLAKIYVDQGETKKAVMLLETGNGEIPGDINILTNLSSMYLEDEDIEKLSKSLKEIREIDPDHMGFLKLSAGYALLRKNYTNAIFFANRAMLSNPYDDDNLYLRGSAQLINKDSLSALISFEEAYKLKKSYRNFAKVFDVSLAVGKLDKAKIYLDDFELQNTPYPLCYEKGAYYNEFGDEETSKIILFDCKQTKPEEDRIDYELARIFYKNNDIDSTLYFVNIYLEQRPKDINGYVLKAKTLERISYFSDARKLYVTALEIDSTSRSASNGLESLEQRVAYLRLVKRKEETREKVQTLKPIGSKVIN